MAEFFDRYWQVAVLLGMLAILASFEDRSQKSHARSDRRLVTNLGLGGVSLFLPTLVPLTTIAAAGLAAELAWRPLAAFGVAIAFAVLLLGRSLAAYWLHRATHRYRWLWRFHAVHHADLAVDLTTGWRNHPLEVMLASAVAAAIVLLLGPPPGVVIAVDFVLLLGALWEHADIGLAPHWSRRVERILATPAFHRIHHSRDPADFDCNFGGLLTVWDRLFGTWKTPGASISAFGVEGEVEHADSISKQMIRPFRRQT